MPMPKLYSPEELQLAVIEVTEGLSSYAQARRKYGVPRATLCDHIKGRSNTGSRPGRKNSIPEEVERNIVESICQATQSGFPITKEQLLEKVGRTAKQLRLRTQFKGKRPADRYWRGLKKRFPKITIRNPECCLYKHLKELSKETVASHFEDLHNLIKSHNLSPEAIWNMAETVLQFPQRPNKVTAKKGNRPKSTIVAAINAAGTALPPMVIVDGKSSKRDTSLGPANTHWTHRERSSTNNTLGMEWFDNVFLKNCGTERPQLLLLDSHCNLDVIELLEAAEWQQIRIFALPSHTTQRLQPLATNVFKPFKAAYNTACTDFLSTNPSKVVDNRTFPLVFGKAWETFSQTELLKKAFASTGIYPPNPESISDDLSPSSSSSIQKQKLVAPKITTLDMADSKLS